MKVKLPKVSICIPTYNQISLLKKSIDSILMQDFDDYEIIITDDSSDSCVENLIESYLENFNEKIKYFKNKNRLGSPENWNEAIRKSSGKYIKVLHHDDWFNYPNSLRVLVNLLDRDPNAIMGFVCSRIVDVDNSKTLLITNPSNLVIELVEKTPESLIYANWIGTPSAAIFRKQEYAQLFDRNLKWFVDLDAYVYLLKKRKSKLAFNPIDGVSIGMSNMQVTNQCVNNKTVNLFEFFYFLDKWKIADLMSNEMVLKKACLLLSKFNVKSRTEIRKAGFKGRLPKGLSTLIKYINSADLQ